MTEKKPKLDISAYNIQQIIEIFTCPVNRHSTRVEYQCSDVELYDHPDWLIKHFIENGGAEAFAKKRLEFQKLCDKTGECSFAEECELSRIYSGWMHCPIKKNGNKCMKCQSVKQKPKNIG